MMEREKKVLFLVRKHKWVYIRLSKIGQVTCTVIDCTSALPIDNQWPKNSIKGQPVSPKSKGYKSNIEVLH